MWLRLYRGDAAAVGSNFSGDHPPHPQIFSPGRRLNLRLSYIPYLSSYLVLFCLLSLTNTKKEKRRNLKSGGWLG